MDVVILALNLNLTFYFTPTLNIVQTVKDLVFKFKDVNSDMVRYSEIIVIIINLIKVPFSVIQTAI